MSPSPQLPHFTSAIASALALGTAILVAQNDVRENRPPAGGRAIRSNRNTPDETGAAKRENAVSITTEGDFRVIKSNGWPDHAPGDFPRRGNPNTASPQNYAFRIPLKPAAADEPQRRGGWFFGVAVNGVPFEAGTAETWNNDPRSGWRYEANTGFLNLGLDEHSAHVQPNGAYHYHATPTGLVQRLGGDEGKMLLIAWAADGYEVFTAFCSSLKDGAPGRAMKSSWRLKPGARPEQASGPGGNYDGRFTEDWEFAKDSGDLDELNGTSRRRPSIPQASTTITSPRSFRSCRECGAARRMKVFPKAVVTAALRPVRADVPVRPAVLAECRPVGRARECRCRSSSARSMRTATACSTRRKSKTHRRRCANWIATVTEN